MTEIVPLSVRKKIIELWDQKSHADEEESFLRDKLLNISTFYLTQHAVLQRLFSGKRENDEKVQATAIFEKMFLIELSYRSLCQQVHNHLTIPDMEYSVSTEDHMHESKPENYDSEWSETDSDQDEEEYY